MAFGARELVLILRATNQASGPLRQVSRDLRSLGTGGVAAGRAMDRVTSARRWQKFGLASAVLRDTGRTARLAGIAVGAGLGFAATSAAKFNTQAGLVATQTGAMNKSVARTTTEFNRNASIIEQGILKQMRKFPAPAQEMSDALYEIYSSTNLGSQGLKGVTRGLTVLNLMNKAAVAGQVDLSDVTKATTTVMNAFGGGVKILPKRMERMFAAVRFGRTTFAELLQAFNQIIPSGKVAGQSFDTIIGSFAALTRLMPNTRMASTALSRLMEIMGRKAFVTGAKAWGMNITDSMGRLKPLNVVVGEFNKLVARTPEKERANLIRNFFKEISKLGEGTKSGFEATVQARRALTHLMKSYGLYTTVLGQVKKDQNEFTKSFRVMAERSGIKWDTFINRMRAAWIALGAAAIPVLLALLDPLRRAAEWFAKLDKETRTQVARWIALGAAITIIGGTIASLVGNFGTMIAVLKASGGSLTMFLGTIGLVAAALLILAGHGDLVGKAIEHMFDFATSSALNFVIALGLVALAVRRLQLAVMGSALIGGMATKGKGLIPVALFGSGGARAMSAETRAIQEQARAARGMSATLLPSGRQVIMREGPASVARSSKTIVGASKAMAGASKVARFGMLGIAGAAAMIGPQLLVVAGITAAIAGSAYLWSRHQKAVAEEAARTARFLAAAQEPVRAAERVAAFGIRTQDARRMKLDLGDITARIKLLTKAHKEATGAEKAQLGRDLERAWLDKAVTLAEYQSAVRKVMQASAGVPKSIGLVARNLQTIDFKQDRIARLKQMIAGIENLSSRSSYQSTILRAHRKEVERLQGEIAILGVNSVQAGVKLQQGIGQSLRALRDAHLVKFPIAKLPDIREAISQVALRRGRMLKLPEIRQVIKAILDPASLEKMPGDIQRAIGLIKITAMVQTQRKIVGNLQRQVKERFNTQMGGRDSDTNIVQTQVKLRGASVALKATKDLHAKMINTFKKAITQTVKVRVVPPDTSKLGLAISMGVAAGIYAGIPEAVAAATLLMSSVEAASAKAIEKGSPSRLFARTIGTPIVQGIIVGMQAGTRDLQLAGSTTITSVAKGMKASFGSVMQMIDLFQGKVMSNLAEPMNIEFFSSEALQDKKKITSALLIKDLQIQVREMKSYNAAMAQLSKRGVPRELLSQLSQLGTEGAAKLRVLGNATKQELNRYVAAWRTAQAQIKRASRVTVGNLQADLNAQLADLNAFNKAMTKLSRKKIPIELFSQLAQGGVENLKMIETLAKATPKQLAKYVKAWTSATAALNKFATMPAWDEILQKNQEFMRELFDPMEIVSRLSSIKDAFRSGFGEIFGGSMNLRSMIGSEFQGAMDSWSSEMAGLQEELQDAYADLNKAHAEFAKESAEEQMRYAKEVADTIAEYNEKVTEEAIEYAKKVAESHASRAKDIAEETIKYEKAIAEAQADAIRERFDELKSAFGDVFDNVEDMFKDKIEWGIALGMDDLKAALQAQVNMFKRWRTSLGSLIGRGLPPELMADLEKLGPKVTGMLETLVAATDADLTEWVNLWKQSHTEIKTIADTATADTSDILASFNEAIAEIEKQNTATLTELAADNAKTITDLARDHSKSMTGIDERYAETMRDMNERYAETIAGIMERIADINDRIMKTAATIPKKLTFADILADLQAQIDLFHRWTTSLQTLVNRGLPYELIEQIRELGPEATEIIEVLANSTDTEIREYIALWERGGVLLGDAIGTWSKHITPDLILGGMKQAAAEWGTWQNTLMSLTGRLNTELTTQFGAAGKNLRIQLMNELRALGPEAIPYLQALNSMTDSQLAEFVRLWKASGGQIRDTSSAEYQEQLRIWTENGRAMSRGFLLGLLESAPKLAKDMGITLKGIMGEAYTNSSGTYFGSGAALGANVANGINSQADAVRAAVANLTAMNAAAAAAQWVGTTVTAGVVSGMNSEAATLSRAVTTLATNSVIRPFRTGLQAESPSKVFMGFGKNIVEGLILGIKNSGAITPTVNRPVLMGKSGVGGGDQITMHITAHQDESLISTLERARFRLINRR